MDERSPSQPPPQSQSRSQILSPKSEIQNPNTPVAKPETSAVSASSTMGSAVASAAIEAQSVTELANVSSPPSKMPLRPRKIRKLSSEDVAKGDSNSSGTASAPPKSAGKGKLSQSRALTVPRVAARALSCEGEIEIAIRHLRSADPLLASLIDFHPLPTFDSFNRPFMALIKSILSQQLAAKAGTSIYARFISLFGGENGVVPETVLALTPQQLRQIGVSGRKASYIHDLARKYQNGILSDSAILAMDDKSLFTMLTMVNGIGSWSVHMFMIHSLHRPDVLPINDLVVRKGVQTLYNLEELPRPSQMDQFCNKWRPYRSVASWYLWRLMESKGTPSSATALASAPPLMPPPQQLEEHHHHHHQQQQQQTQLLDPMNTVFNIGACSWGHS